MNAFNTAVSEEHLSNLRDLIKSAVTQHVRAQDLSEIMVTWVWTMATNMATSEHSPLRYITQVFNRRAGIILKTNYKHWRGLFQRKTGQIRKLWYENLEEFQLPGDGHSNEYQCDTREPEVTTKIYMNKSGEKGKDQTFIKTTFK